MMFLVLLIFFLSLITSADLINPGEKLVSISYTISNIDLYDDNIVILYGMQYKIIQSDNLFSFNTYDFPLLYAVKKSSLEGREPEELTYNQTKDLIDQGKTVNAHLSLQSFVPSVHRNDPLEFAVISMEIISLNETEFIIQKKKIIYVYDDGFSEEKPFISQNILPNRSRDPLLYETIWYLGIPICSIFIITSLLIFRYRKSA